MNSLRSRTLCFLMIAAIVVSVAYFGWIYRPANPDPWTETDIALLQSLRIENLQPLPPDHSNAVANDNDAVILGNRLFFDTRLSANGRVSCATCHQQSMAFTDGRKLGRGIGGQNTDRNTMSIVNVLWSSPRMFWDGRAVSLEDQALQPIADHKEMNLPIKEAVMRLRDIPEYQEKFKDAFGTNEMEKEHIAKALAQFQRTMVSQDSKYDKFLKGEVQLSEMELGGSQCNISLPIPMLLLVYVEVIAAIVTETF